VVYTTRALNEPATVYFYQNEMRNKVTRLFSQYFFFRVQACLPLKKCVSGKKNNNSFISNILDAEAA
jgi:hypothetical protein